VVMQLVAKLSKWIYSDFSPVKEWEILLQFAESQWQLCMAQPVCRSSL